MRLSVEFERENRYSIVKTRKTKYQYFITEIQILWDMHHHPEVTVETPSLRKLAPNLEQVNRWRLNGCREQDPFDCKVLETFLQTVAV